MTKKYRGVGVALAASRSRVPGRKASRVVPVQGTMADQGTQKAMAEQAPRGTMVEQAVQKAMTEQPPRLMPEPPP